MDHVLQAARLHVIHPLVILGIPLLVVAISFAINVDAATSGPGSVT